MKNLKVSTKLIVSFLIVIVLTAIVGGAGIIGMMQMGQGADELYDRQLLPIIYLADARQTFQRNQTVMREVALARGSDERLDVHRAAAEQNAALFHSFMHEFGITIIDPEVRNQFDNVMRTFDEWQAVLLHLVDVSRVAASSSEIVPIMEDSAVPLAANLMAAMDSIVEARVAQAEAVDQEIDDTYTTMLVIIIIALAAAVIIAISLAFYISGLISKPIVNLSRWMEHAGTTGDITMSESDSRDIEEMGKVKDEIGGLFRYTGGLIAHIGYIAKEVEVLASGDLTHELKLLSNDDTVGKSLLKMTDSLNNMFSEINTATTQVASGSKQISDGAQTLAQGSTEQAASVQELSSSIHDIASKTKENADMANRAATLANSIKSSAEKGSHQMDEMMTAVRDINASSQNIGKVIKSIDDIAFQTNILALNAAVEAARAGQHGKGFAVVAEEVRNLAAKSAEAAKDTESLIADSIEKAELGSRIADDTAASLTEIVSGIGESSKLVGEIARSSEDQSVGIEQINRGIDQVAQVTQQNSATAEQSAAASQEMSGQSMMLEELISRFKLKGSGAGLNKIDAPKQSLSASQNDEFDDSFGKY
ncbi:MAG: methyl-accepting chemotaxis protein [Oscillospiraceae bacterium]|nr:methyl-accepting chemotaxis protein [Oscillospiraceae bacterium]